MKLLPLTVCFLFLATTQVLAEGRNPSLNDTLSFRFGPFWANLDATVDVRGHDLKIKEDIDTGNIDFSIYGLWRITPRLLVEGGYSGIDKKESEFIDQNIPLDFLTIPAGTQIEGELETQVLRLALGYALFRGDAYEFGADLGVNVTSLKQSFRTSASGMPIESLDVTEPLPTIGLFFNYAFTEKLYFTTRAGIFALSIGDIDGTILDFHGGLEYRPWKHFGLGLAYTYTSADVTIKSDGIETDVDYDYNGPIAYLVVGF